jgi:NitT/TauT family transport system ATP-binding protein
MGKGTRKLAGRRHKVTVKALRVVAPGEDVKHRKPTVVVNGVSKSFGGTRGRSTTLVLQEVSLEVREGEFVAIIGPSGCGKSTLLSVIAGYTEIDEGSVTVGAKAVHGPGSDRVMVFQRPTLFPWMTARENVAFGLTLRSNRAIAPGTDEVVKQTAGLLDMIGLSAFGDHYPFELSGGMQQRIEIARALAVKPQVLLMDEPFGALDALTRRSMQQELSEIHRKSACTTLFVTHDVYEAIVLADRVVVMSSRPGRIREIISVNLARDLRRDSVEAVELARHMSDLLHAGKVDHPA